MMNINKKASTTFTGLVIAIITVMALFYGLFGYVSTNYENVNITETMGYNQSLLDIEDSQASLNYSIEEIKNSTRAIAEAPGNVVSVAWNGLTGLAATIRLFFSTIDIAITVWNALLPGLSFLPIWAKLLIEMALVITIVLVILGAFKGEAKT